MGSKRRTLSSAFVVPVVIVVFCLTDSSRAAAQANSQGVGESESSPSSGEVVSSANDQFTMSSQEQFALLVVLVALAAYLRLRIEWSKDRIRSRRWVLSFMLGVEAIIAMAGYLLVYRICREQFWWPLPDCFDLRILWTFRLGVGGLAILHFLQLVLDVRWMFGRARVPPGFLLVGENKAKVTTMIRLKEVRTLEQGDDNSIKVEFSNGKKKQFQHARLG